MVITFNDVSFKYLEKKLLDGVSFSLTDSDKVGIVGINGTGKTTLLKLIIEEEKPQKGTIIKSGGMIINYLPQEPVFPRQTKLLDLLMAKQTPLHPINDYEAKSILSKLKLDSEATVDHMSGGEIKRLALACALVSYCDILILDEPTNHLDNDMILWLEKYLQKFKHGLIMVTHDRYFLERICTKMLELENGKTYLYEANYSKFLEFKALRLENESRQKAKLKSILAHEQEWMNRGVEARRTKSKSRIERFQALKEIEFAENKKMSFSSIDTYLGKKIIEIKQGSKAYGSKVLFQDLNFSLNRNDIVGFVGANGAGKSTLFKIIMGEETLDSGELIKGETLKIGYFSQQLALPDPEIRVIDYIKEEHAYIETLEGTISATKLLDNFLFSDDLKYSKVKMLSGGEKRRLQLVRVLIKNPNVLILDEPTNDLDIYTLEILEDYLLDFKGPILVVSHDRYFLDKICNKLFVFENTFINEYLVSFSEYLDLPKIKDVVETKPKEVSKRPKLSSKERSDLDNLPQEIAQIEEKIQNLKKELAKLTTEYTQIMELSEQISNLEKEVDTKIERLFYLQELKESLSNF